MKMEDATFDDYLEYMLAPTHWATECILRCGVEKAPLANGHFAGALVYQVVDGVVKAPIYRYDG